MQVGRPWLYGSIIAGQAGVEQVLSHTLADLDSTLGLAGFTNLSEVQGKGEEILAKIAWKADKFLPNGTNQMCKFKMKTRVRITLGDLIDFFDL